MMYILKRQLQEELQTCICPDVQTKLVIHPPQA